ncbi:MAG: CRISPR-associated endonuclease Cas2 [Leptospiraceae bacterium]|nr:CRISPR-associated endonuclease Cas2 [Leptospiraceae bacterium]MCK6382489.1 CRISPR-associated endonuclease Cas2 [Leptospiraceae bacterium]NUM41666.1 CRISPR-associated endonuclease Cas2 [Leptospiraceae bacterium]
MYIEIIVCYDISSNKSRRKLVKELKDMGLSNIQESVFWGRVLNAEISSIKRIFTEILDKEFDRAFLVKTNFSKQAIEYSFGYKDVKNFQERDYEIV